MRRIIISDFVFLVKNLWFFEDSNRKYHDNLRDRVLSSEFEPKPKI